MAYGELRVDKLVSSAGEVDLTTFQSQKGIPTFIQSTEPTEAQLGTFTKFAWWDTSEAGKLTLWIEDGQ
jgi:hypothetical protein